MSEFFKNNKIYKYFSWQFKSIDDKHKELQKRMDAIENQIAEVNRVTKEINLKIDECLIENNSQCGDIKTRELMKKYDIILERTKQLDYINTELLKLKEIDKCKILIVGFYGAPNTGDELMLQAILNKLDCDSNEVTVMIADNPYYNIMKKYKVNYIHYPKTNMDINMISKYFDKIIFGGGAILDDSEYDNELAYKDNVANILIDLATKAIYDGKEVYCIGLSSNYQLSNKEYLKHLEFIIKNANHFSLRDKNSKNTLISAEIERAEEIRIINDIAYSLPKMRKDIDKLTNNIGVVLIGFAEKDKLINIVKACDTIVQKYIKNAKILLIPFYNYNKSDIYEYNKILENIETESNVQILEYKKEYDNVMEQFNNCDLLVCMRYHASLLALKAGIPSVHIVYDVHKHYQNKMNYLKEIYGYDETYISFKDFDQKQVEESLKFVLDNYKEMNKKYIQISEKIEERACQELEDILSFK